MKHPLKAFLQLLSLATITVSLPAQTPWNTHGKLETSDNGHFIQHEDGTPFLWIGDTG